MELFAQFFNLLLFYINISVGFWITWILLKKNRKENRLALDNIYIYIYIYLIQRQTIFF